MNIETTSIITLLLTFSCAPPTLTGDAASETQFAANDANVEEQGAAGDAAPATDQESIFEQRSEGSADEATDIVFSMEITGSWLSAPGPIDAIGVPLQARRAMEIKVPRIADKAVGLFSATRQEGKVYYHCQPIFSDAPLKVAAGTVFQFGALAVPFDSPRSIRVPPFDAHFSRLDDEISIDIEFDDSALLLSKVSLLRTASAPEAGSQPCPNSSKNKSQLPWTEMYASSISETLPVGTFISDVVEPNSLPVYAVCLYNLSGELLSFPNIYAPAAPAALTQVTDFVRPRLNSQQGLFVRLARLPADTQFVRNVSFSNPHASFLTGLVDVKRQDHDSGFPGLSNLDENFGLSFDGFIFVPEAGTYDFKVTSDDGAILSIDGEEIVDNDGRNSSTSEEGSTKFAAAGFYKFALKYYQGPAQVHLELGWRRRDRQAAFSKIPANAYYLNKGTTIAEPSSF